MLRVKTYVSFSTIAGMGLFANEDIEQDQLMWSYEANFDRSYSEQEFETLNSSIQDYIERFGFQCPRTKTYFLSMDGDKYTNHSFTPNTYEDKTTSNLHALRKIMKDEEITANYKDFDLMIETKLHNNFKRCLK